MFKKVINWFKQEAREVDTVVSEIGGFFGNYVKELEARAKAVTEEATELEKEIASLIAEKEAKLAEAAKALTFIAKLKSIF